MIHGKGAGVEVVLVPDSLADGEAIVGFVDGVVDGDDDGQEPGEESEDLVGGDGPRRVRLALGEGVPWDSKLALGTGRPDGYRLPWSLAPGGNGGTCRHSSWPWRRRVLRRSGFAAAHGYKWENRRGEAKRSEAHGGNEVRSCYL